MKDEKGQEISIGDYIIFAGEGAWSEKASTLEDAISEAKEIWWNGAYVARALSFDENGDLDESEIAWDSEIWIHDLWEKYEETATHDEISEMQSSQRKAYQELHSHPLEFLD